MHLTLCSLHLCPLVSSPTCITSPSPALSACAPSAGCVVPCPAFCPLWAVEPAEAPARIPSETEGLWNMCFWEADTSWLGRHLHIQLSPPEPSRDGEEEAMAGQREREGPGQLGVRQNRFWIGETDGESRKRGRGANPNSSMKEAIPEP